MIRLILAYTIIGIFFVTERQLRRGQAALTLDAGQADRGSTHLIGAAFGIMINVLLVAPLLNHLRVGQFKTRSYIPWLGIPLMVVGLLLRAWANRTLGEFYTRTLVTTAQQSIVEAGPYRLLRHPGYLGNILMWLGAALATANWIALALAVLTMLTAYLYRIHSEEEMLKGAFGEKFENYRARTWSLIPGVY
jgi:protein-S-isoprenylcysteine O-methyltransferase Ste14